MTPDGNDNHIQNFIEAAKDGKWVKVLKMYEDKKELRRIMITATGDTVLHMAASNGQAQRVKRMVELICSKEKTNEQDSEIVAADENGDEKKDVLGAENEKGNTPLHLAASAINGSYVMCEMIGNAYPSSITRCNKAGETPLFLAALHGNKEAFLWLHSHSPQGFSGRHGHYKRNDDDTILHCAIAGGHIDVAIEIVDLYKNHLREMTMMRNKIGLSPLHVLAVTPSAFESTDLPNRSFIVRLLYHWFFRVNMKKQVTTMEGALVKFGSISEDIAEKLPSCIATIWLLIVFPLRLLAWVLLVLLIVLEILLPAVNWFGNKFQKWFHGIQKMEKKYTWSIQIVDILLHQHVSNEEKSVIISRKPFQSFSTFPKTKEYEEPGSKIVDPPLVIAAKNGVIEMVTKILEFFPPELEIVDDEGKNVVLLAAENRQTKLYQFLCRYEFRGDSPFNQVDNDGNTALHLAANPRISLIHWQTTTMVEEIKWFELVKSSLPCELREKYNNYGETAEEIFRENYEKYMTSDRELLNQTSNACSVASTVVASMAFSNFAGENMNKKNYSSLVALSLALTSTICFLAILAFRSGSLNFWRFVPFMLQLAILTMFGSIVALWISLMVHGRSITASAILGLPIAILTIGFLPIFIGPALNSVFTKVPAPSRNTTSAIRYRRPQKKENVTDFDRIQEPTPNYTFRPNIHSLGIGDRMTHLRGKRMRTVRIKDAEASQKSPSILGNSDMAIERGKIVVQEISHDE